MNQDAWLKKISTLIVVLLLLYIIPHFFVAGERTAMLSSSQLAGISTLIGESDTIPKRQVIVKIASYVVSSLDETVLTDFQKLLEPYETREFVTVLSAAKIKLTSFFWLHGAGQFVEIIFWSIFGVLASVLYTGSEAIRLKDFKSREIAVHIAKIFYAPLCSIIIILSISVLSGNGDVSMDIFQFWLIVLSFILGFFSGRTVELLNRLKDLLLPVGRIADTISETKFELRGVVTAEASVQGVDMAKVVVKLLSMSDPSISDIGNPDVGGNFVFTGLSAGDYAVVAEYKSNNNSFEGRKSIKLPQAKDEPIVILLTKMS